MARAGPRPTCSALALASGFGRRTSPSTATPTPARPDHNEDAWFSLDVFCNSRQLFKSNAVQAFQQYGASKPLPTVAFLRSRPNPPPPPPQKQTRTAFRTNSDTPLTPISPEYRTAPPPRNARAAPWTTRLPPSACAPTAPRSSGEQLGCSESHGQSHCSGRFPKNPARGLALR